MHPVQQSILDLAQTRDLGRMKLREIGEAIGGELPQTIKYHLDTLLRRGFLEKAGRGSIRRVDSNHEIAGLVQIPILGEANCGEALVYAENDIRGFLSVAPSLLKTRQYKDIFCVKAVGRSMNAADINGRGIQDGDYVIAQKMPDYENNAYIVATFEGRANVKRLIKDEREGLVILKSESFDGLPPIYITPGDVEKLQVHGKVIGVLPAPENLVYA